MATSNHVPNDGYTESAYIAEIKRLHTTVRFKFRPSLLQERSKLASENARLAPHLGPVNTAKFLAGKIVEWDVKDQKGEPLDISPEVLMRLKPALLERITAIVLGFDGGDEDPDAATPDGEKIDDLSDSLEALSGKALGDARQDRKEKNSPEGSRPS
jgi:hypothetical protein